MTVWNFSCTADGGSYDLEIGPQSGFDATFQRSMNAGSMPSTGAAPFVVMKPPAPAAASIKGVLLSEAQYDSLATWWRKGNRVIVKDRVGRVFTVLIGTLDRQRQHSASHTWKHAWDMGLEVLGISVPGITPDGLTWAMAEGLWSAAIPLWGDA